MQVFIPSPLEEPEQPNAPEWAGDTRRAPSQPALPVQDSAYRLFANSQTFTERQNEHTNYVRDNLNWEAFGEMVFQRQNDYGGCSWEAGTATRSSRKKK